MEESPILRPPNAKSHLIGKDPDAGENWRQNGKGQQKKRWLDSITNSRDMNLSKLQEIVKTRGSWCAEVHEVTKSWIWLQSESEVAQSFPTLCDHMDCNLPGFSVLGIFQTRVLEWVAISFSREFPHPGIEPRSPALQADSLLTELFLKKQLSNEYSGLISFKIDWFDYVLWKYVT